MHRTRHRARNFYSGFLNDHENVVTSTDAVWGGTGAHIGFAAVAGVLTGWLYALYVAAPLLPSFVLGGSTGVIVGYAIATRAARRPAGPGAVHLGLIETTERLIVVRRYPMFRHHPLRSYQLDRIAATSTQMPVGNYQRLLIREPDQPVHDFIVSGEILISSPSEKTP